MPQTVEAIQHARAAKVPLIVAVNKIDKPEANPERVKQGLIQHEVLPEEFGGDTIFAPVSAKTGQGVDALLDSILLQAEVMELTAVVDARASGTVVESSLDKGRGPVATVLVQQGTLKRGDFLVCGLEYGRVRALFNEAGQQIDEAGPSIPAQVLGLSGVPDAGDDFVVVADERLAKDVAQQRQAKRRESRLVRTQSNKLEDIMAQMGQQQGGDQAVLNLVVKADVQGSAEALRDALTKLSTDAVKINVIGSGVGGITESDNDAGLDVRYFSIIYDVIDQVKQVATGLLGMEVREEIIGVAQVREVFRSSKFGAIAGCMVIEGNVKRNKPIRVLRDNVVIFQGELESLRRFKENVEDVRAGMECGIGVKQYNDVKAGDQIECFERIEVQRTFCGRGAPGVFAGRAHRGGAAPRGCAAGARGGARAGDSIGVGVRRRGDARPGARHGLRHRAAARAVGAGGEGTERRGARLPPRAVAHHAPAPGAGAALPLRRFGRSRRAHRAAAARLAAARRLSAAAAPSPSPCTASCSSTSRSACRPTTP
jgi:translation initiation factor IF-2